jgi:hypothetical protein
MCDYSLHSVTSRLAKVGDKLTTRDFGTGTRGFAASENQKAVLSSRGYIPIDRYVPFDVSDDQAQDGDLSANQ